MSDPPFCLSRRRLTLAARSVRTRSASRTGSAPRTVSLHCSLKSCGSPAYIPSLRLIFDDADVDVYWAAVLYVLYHSHLHRLIVAGWCSVGMICAKTESLPSSSVATKIGLCSSLGKKPRGGSSIQAWTISLSNLVRGNRRKSWLMMGSRRVCW